MTYPHQGPTGCLTIQKVFGIWTNPDPYIIWPYYIGRDKGPHVNERGIIPAFRSPGFAWKYIFDVVQPDDMRACENYKVLRISEYMKAIRGGEQA
jgi:hypothetical protein